jgi:hypothetical protein
MELAAALATDDPLLAREARAAARLARGPAKNARWVHEATEHYALLTDTDEKTRALVAKTLEEGWQSYAAEFAPPGAWRPQEVVVFDSREEFLDWVRTFAPELGTTSDGFYDPSHDQLVFYERLDDRTMQITRELTFHEAFHGYAARALPVLPTWLNEGLAESFGNSVWGGKAGRCRDSLERFAVEPRLGAAGWRTFVDQSYEAFHDREHQEAKRHDNYARAWVAAKLLRDDTSVLRGVLIRLLEALRRLPFQKAHAEALDDGTLGILDKAFRREVAKILQGS